MEEQNEGSKQISDALTNMSESAQKVQSASKEMSESNKSIFEEMNSLQLATESMQSGMEEMAEGARKINATGDALAQNEDMEGLKIRVMNSRILFWTSTHEFQKIHWAGQNARSATQYFITQKKLHPEPS